MNWLFPKICIVCKVNSQSILCPNCMPKYVTPVSQNSNISYLYRYKGSIKEIIHKFKFEGEKSIGKFLIISLDPKYLQQFDLIIPVPCHWLRLLQRRFNHLNYLFDFLPNFNAKLVKREKYTGYFHKLNKQERELRIKNAFNVVQGERVTGKKILIVDDIITTGTTFNELSNELCKYNPSSIHGLFLAKV